MKNGMTRKQFLKCVERSAIVLGLATIPSIKATGTKHKASSKIIAGDIHTRIIPKTGDKIPGVGLGSFETFDVDLGTSLETVTQIIDTFYKGGGRVIDTSPLYGNSEVAIGHSLSRLGITDNVFLSNKIWATGEFLGDVSQGLNQWKTSQQRLWRNTIDLVHVHSLVDAASKIPLLMNLREQGSIKYIGAAHWLTEGYDDLENILRSADLDFIQINYSIMSRKAEERLIPLAKERGVAVMTNMAFEKARLFKLVENVSLPPFAAEMGIKSWADYFLRFVLSNENVTCVLIGTSNPAHMQEDMVALRGQLPDVATRKKMIEFVEKLPGADFILKTPPYPGKKYRGVVKFPPPKK